MIKRLRLLALLVAMMKVATAVPCFAGFEVSIHVNYPADVIYADATNTIEIWIENSLPLAGVSLPFWFTTNAGTLSWIRPYGDIPASNPCVDVSDDIPPYVWGDMNGWQCVVYPGNKFLLGGATINQANYFPAHTTPRRVLSLKLDGSTLSSSGGVFCVKAAFIPPAGNFLFDTGGNSFTPQFYLCSNCNPEDPDVCFAIVQRPWIKGDANSDGRLNISDAVFLVNYIFAGGRPPEYEQAADADCDGVVSISDVVSIVDYIFDGGAPPC